MFGKNKEKKPGVVAPPVEAKPEIRQVVGYMMDGVFYRTAEEAKQKYIVTRLEALVSYHSYRYFNTALAANNLDKIAALLKEEIPVVPLFSECK